MVVENEPGRRNANMSIPMENLYWSIHKRVCISVTQWLRKYVTRMSPVPNGKSNTRNAQKPVTEVGENFEF